PAATDIEGLLRNNDVGMTLVNLAEAIDVAQRVHRLSPAEVRETVEPLFEGGLRLEPQVDEQAWQAAELRLRHYDRRRRALSLADCFLLVAAQAGDGVATADPAVAEVARNEGIGLMALPDTEGQVP